MLISETQEDLLYVLQRKNGVKTISQPGLPKEDQLRGAFWGSESR